MTTHAYDIITDSTANLPDDLIKDWRLRVLPLEYIVDDASHKGYDPEVPTDNQRYYQMMRDGKVVKTAMASVKDAEALLRDCFDSGRDAIYIGFDSLLSANYEVISTYMEKFREEHYPERKLSCVDTLAATMGEGMIVAHAVKKREAGLSLEQLEQFVASIRLQVACWFTVDDLKYLQRGGRLTAAAAFAGTLLNILPILHIDVEGRLIPREKLRGRRRVLQFLADKVCSQIVQSAEDLADSELAESLEQFLIEQQESLLVYISHADCIDDVQVLMGLIEQNCPKVEFVVNDLDPVVGAHTGPGTICVFFLSKEGRG